MIRLLLLTLYYCSLPFFLIFCLPGYLIKMKKRGGFGTGISERFSIYNRPVEEEEQGGLYVHAVSVGESFIAMKLIREWQATGNSSPVTLAVSTATAHHIVSAANLPHTRLIYAPLDIPIIVERCLNRFRPSRVALIEAELWPHFAECCHRRGIPLCILNARLSPRSERRYKGVRPITRALFCRLNALGAQNERDAERFAGIGIEPSIIEVTGSIKFDILADTVPTLREDMANTLSSLSGGSPIILAASTHAGEEQLLADAIRKAGGFPLIIPRHEERREEVLRDLRGIGFTPLLRSQHLAENTSLPQNYDCYIADTTGELRDWTQHAQLVIIGKSFLSKGGQNPVEAIAARIPVIAGPDMSNFADLVTLLEEKDGIYRSTVETLYRDIEQLLQHPEQSKQQCEQAYAALSYHQGATERSVTLLTQLCSR